MDFPRDRIGFTTTHNANTSEKGWLVLDIHGLDLEAVHKLYIDLSHLDEVREKLTCKAQQAKMVKNLFAKKQEGAS